MKLDLRGAMGSFAVLLGVLALWAAVTQAQLISRVFLPSPSAVWASLAEGLTQGDLVSHTWHTVQRMAVGWLLASLLGVALGALVGVSATVRAWVQPLLEFMRPLPASAVLPLAISLFGLSGGMVLAVVAFGSMWPVLLATVHGFVHLHPTLREVGRQMQLSRVAFVFKLGLPNALPDILAGLRLSLTVSLIVSVVGEMLASQPGLGQSILLAARSFRAPDLFAGIVLLGLIGLLSNAALALAEHRALRWQRSH